MITRLFDTLRRVRDYAMLKPFTWIEENRLAACSYPRKPENLRDLSTRGVTLVINLHERPHPPESLAGHGFTMLHLPVRDFTPPTPEQLQQGVDAISAALDSGGVVAVHCGAGLGRTGTLLAAYLTTHGHTSDAAIAAVRAARPGSVETPEQEAAIKAFAATRASMPD